MVVERIPRCAWTSNNLSFNHVNSSTLLVARESKYIYQHITKCYGSSICMISLFIIDSEVIREIMHLSS